LCLVDGWYAASMPRRQPSPRPTAEDEAVLAQVWARLSGLFVDKRNRVFQILHDHGLTPPHGFALTMLAGGPVRMRDLADDMRCDASYITAIVDRLEEAGLVVRRPGQADRRVKEVALTAAGEEAAAGVTKAMTAPPAVLQRLSPADRRAMLEILSRILPEPPADTNPFGPVHRT